jgi:hypothetical protein
MLSSGNSQKISENMVIGSATYSPYIFLDGGYAVMYAMLLVQQKSILPQRVRHS